LTVAQQDNEVDSSQNATLAPGQAPTIDTSTITTQVMVPNSDVLVLGGLLRKDRSVSKSGVPILSDIPLLGRLFTLNTVNHGKQNLLVFLKPTVLNNEDDDKKISHGLYNAIRTDQLNLASHDAPSLSSLNPIFPRIQAPAIQAPSGQALEVVLPKPFENGTER
jgi:general secretion pathway protein D